MNDVNHTGINSSLRLYADDTTQYASDLCPPVQYSLNQDIHTLCGWFNENFLHIDGAKTKAMILGKSSYDLRIANDTIKVEDTLKILGVNWTMASPSSRMSQKCSRKLMIAALLRLKRMVPVEIVMKLYNAYILPHLEYCSPILIGISKPLKNKLEHARGPKLITHKVILKRIIDLKGFQRSIYLAMNFSALVSLKVNVPVGLGSSFEIVLTCV